MTTRGTPGADAAGRTRDTASEFPVGEAYVFVLEETPPPTTGSWTGDGWKKEVGNLISLRIEGHKEGWDPWVAVGEIEPGHLTLAAVEFT